MAIQYHEVHMLIIKYPGSNEMKGEDMGETYACMWDETCVMADFGWDDIV